MGVKRIWGDCLKFSLRLIRDYSDISEICFNVALSHKSGLLGRLLTKADFEPESGLLQLYRRSWVKRWV